MAVDGEDVLYPEFQGGALEHICVGRVWVLDKWHIVSRFQRTGCVLHT